MTCASKHKRNFKAGRLARTTMARSSGKACAGLKTRQGEPREYCAAHLVCDILMRSARSSIHLSRAFEGVRRTDRKLWDHSRHAVGEARRASALCDLPNFC